MDNERRKKLNDTLKKFNKKQKCEIFTMGNEIKTLDVISTGISVIDDFIGGGFKCGAHSGIWGVYSVGKTALMLMTIANAQRNGKLVCYVNTEKPIDRERFLFFGVNLDELVYIEAPHNAEHALEAMRTLCKDKVIDLFIVDSTDGLSPKSVQETSKGQERGLDKNNVASLPKTLSNFYNVVNSFVFKAKASVLWIGQARTKGIGSFFVHLGRSGGNAQDFYSYMTLAMRRGQNSDAPVQKFKEYFIDPDGKVRFATVKETIGFDVVIKLEKSNASKSAKEKSEIHIPYLYSDGFVNKVVDSDDVPVKIDAKNDEEKEIIKQFLIEKKPEDAQKLGLIETEPEECPIVELDKDSTIKNPKQQEDINDELDVKNIVKGVTLDSTVPPVKEEKPKKKGRGRPKKDKK
ncbi:MAG: hypothetical protein DRN27_08655 [Thermoplasmata archaeon]|nr:MAG: hypothetical protein DRN27_08655 [Thermoplasmata archaeon]